MIVIEQIIVEIFCHCFKYICIRNRFVDKERPVDIDLSCPIVVVWKFFDDKCISKRYFQRIVREEKF